MDEKEKSIFYKGHTVLEAVILNTVMTAAVLKMSITRLTGLFVSFAVNTCGFSFSVTRHLGLDCD